MILQVRDLRVSFRTEQGMVRAIDGVSFDVQEGEVLGLVGESGSGKTVTLLAVMGLITDPNCIITGSIQYKGRELIGLSQGEMRDLRGREIAMIFQDPMTALTRSIRSAGRYRSKSSRIRRSAKSRPGPARLTCWRRLAFQSPKRPCIAIRISCREGCGSGR